MFSKEYSFGLGQIEAESYFSNDKACGFVDLTAETTDSNEVKSLLAGRWSYRKSDEGALKNAFTTTENGVKILRDRDLLIFRASVPEYGVYKVTATFSAEENPANLTIFTGRRNLVDRKVSVDAGQTYTRSFYTYVTPYIPAISSVPLEDKSVYLSFSGKDAALSSVKIEKADAPTIFIAGDSTLTDQGGCVPYYPIACCCGWAQDLLALTKDIAVCNYAHSGLTTNCFRDDGHWDILKNQIKPGDIFIIQFGHNDQKRRNLMAFGGYYDNLKWYVKEVRALGAFPIICSPISRIPITDESGDHSLLALHALACQQAALECNVPFIDLHTFTFDKLHEIGLENAHDYFIPGDITHTNDYGANFIAEYVAKQLAEIPATSPFISKTSLPEFLPDMDVKMDKVPKEPAEAGSMFDQKPPYLDMDGIEKYNQCLDAFKKGLMDPCVMHIHPTEIMPRAQLLMIYLRALKMNGVRPYLGKYCDIQKYEWDSSYVQACINENLIDETTLCGSYFRPNDPLTNSEFASFCIRGLQPSASQRNLSLEDCLKEAKVLGLLDADAPAQAPIDRQSVYAGLARLMDLLDNSDKGMPSDSEIHPVG